MYSEDKKASVIIEGVSGEQLSSLSINKSNNPMLNNINSYIEGPYDFKINGEIKSAIISINFDSSILNQNAVPTIYYFNQELQKLEELETSINDNTAYAKVNHFSEYILLDKIIVNKTLENLPNIDGSNVESLSNIEYVVITFPILNIFGEPIYVYQISDIEYDLKEMENTLKNYYSNEYNFICKTISKFGAKILDKILAWFENEYINYTPYEDEQEYENILQYLILYRHVYSTKELETYLFGENTNKIKETGGEEIEFDTDSNKDGISDYFTKLICNGQLTTKTGSNPFEGVTYEEIQRNKDFDDDGIKNGEEITIIEDNGKYYIKENSSPILQDTDNDGVKDKDDASPLEAFDNRFISVNNISYIPSTKYEDECEEKSRKVYATKIGDSVDILVRSYIMVSSFGDMPAALALGHFLDNTGTSYDFNSDWSLLETYRGKENLAKNVNSLMSVIESTVKENKTLYFATDKELAGTNFSEQLEDLADIGWWYAVGYTRATMVAKATNIDNNKYKMTLYYNIVDFYDWNGDADFISGFGGLVNDAEMYKLHTYGVAQQYRINIPYKMEITWTKGDRYYLNMIYLYDTPNSMTIKKLN